MTRSHRALAVQTHRSRGIEFHNVSFRYPGAKGWTLREVSFVLGPRECVALVGANGAGKTTIVKLLLRLYDPDEGRIFLDGADLRDYDEVSLQRAMSVVFQDFGRYDFTLRDNIAIGNVLATDQSDRIALAAEHSLASTVAARLERGYDQMLGRTFADGVELSGGEWQRVALARAFMRDAAVVILDEPTSALDARAEYEVFQQFRELMQGRMALIIAHRFSTVRAADRIIVLDSGRIVEQGTHAELVAAGNTYAELFKLQAAAYST